VRDLDKQESKVEFSVRIQVSIISEITI
jgi:hypothetical protein